MVELRPLELGGNSAISGIDVGEDSLDIATIRARARHIEFARISLVTIGSSPFEQIAESLIREVGPFASGAIALIDSPRYPRDVNGESWTRMTPAPAGREIDATLRAIVKDLGRLRLSMFPTPLASWFDACGSAVNCKPHLRAIAHALGVRNGAASRVHGGQLFTRFMLAGFATYRAMELINVAAYESYPHLAFELWRRPDEPLPPKSLRSAALKARCTIIARLSKDLGIDASPMTLDLADAAVLALTAALAVQRGRLFAIECASEGSFALSLTAPQARVLDNRRSKGLNRVAGADVANPR